MQSYGELTITVTELKRKKAKFSEETAAGARPIATPLRASASMAELFA